MGEKNTTIQNLKILTLQPQATFSNSASISNEHAKLNKFVKILIATLNRQHTVSDLPMSALSFCMPEYNSLDQLKKYINKSIFFFIFYISPCNLRNTEIWY